MIIDVFYVRVICMYDQCDSLLCALQLTALIKPNWCVLLCYCACLYHSLIVVQPSWTTEPCPTTKLCLLISKSLVGIKQSVISVALKTPLKYKFGILYLQNFTSASAPVTILVLHQTVSPHFTTKLRPWSYLAELLKVLQQQSERRKWAIQTSKWEVM